jgi:uncharacterized membrane protein YbhN (UPF0104 family)
VAGLPWVDRERLEQMAGSFIDGFGGITTLRLGPPLILWSVAIWTTISAYYWVVLLAFDQAQPFVAGLGVSSVTALGMTIPSSPGFIGIFEFLTRETMVLFGMIQQNLSYAEIQRRISPEAQTST